MSSMILFDDHQGMVASASLQDDAVSVAAEDLEAATGWHLESRGVCRGGECIPEPPAAKWNEAGRFNLSAFAAHRGQGEARDSAGEIWSFGPPGGVRFEDGSAPNFELPDFAGRTHSLSQYRGKKVLLVTWASW